MTSLTLGLLQRRVLRFPNMACWTLRWSVFAALAVLSVLVSGCGGPKSPSVAAVGSKTSAAGTSTTAANSGSASSQALKYTECMRSHGVPDFPDPTSDGKFPRVKLKAGQTQAELQTAETACRNLLPNAGPPSQAQQQQQKSDELEFAQCMRSHGLPNWPGPVKTGTEYEFPLTADGIDPNAPRALTAEQTCQAQLRLTPAQLHIPG